MDTAENMRIAAGIGMGSTRLDNELISDAFVMGSGWATGFIVHFLEDVTGEKMPDDARAQLMFRTYEHTRQVLGADED